MSLKNIRVTLSTYLPTVSPTEHVDEIVLTETDCPDTQCENVTDILDMVGDFEGTFTPQTNTQELSNILISYF